MNESNSEAQPALPYVIPMAGFLILTSVEGYLPVRGTPPSPAWYPLAYTFKIAVVVALIWLCRSTWRDFAPRPRARSAALAAALGLLVTLVWVGLDGLYPALPFLAQRTAYDPTVLSPVGRVAFLAIRLFGLVAVVPLIEELFWRSFLMRWLIDQDFKQVPIGKVTPIAAAITSVLCALAHPEWLPALLTGLAWAWLLARTKSLTACVISHAVANLALGVYVIATGHWKFL
jgi:CAAX prenyl protease-like protein